MSENQPDNVPAPIPWQIHFSRTPLSFSSSPCEKDVALSSWSIHQSYPASWPVNRQAPQALHYRNSLDDAKIQGENETFHEADPDFYSLLQTIRKQIRKEVVNSRTYTCNPTGETKSPQQQESGATKKTWPQMISLHCQFITGPLTSSNHLSLSFPSFHCKYSYFVLVSCHNIHYLFLMSDSSLSMLALVKA